MITINLTEDEHKYLLRLVSIEVLYDDPISNFELQERLISKLEDAIVE